MKALVTFLFFVTALLVHGTETNSLNGRITAILPDRNWSIHEEGNSLVITGPRVKTLLMMNLPPEDWQELWRDYSTTVRVEVDIEFQSPISDEDFTELQNLKRRFDNIRNRMLESKGPTKDDEYVREFGFIRLPDYRSSSASLFVSDNVAARGDSPLEVDPDSVREIVRKIYGVVEDYCKRDIDSAKKTPTGSNPKSVN